METIRAKITKVEQKLGSDWFEISTDDPRVKRLDTKKRELAVIAEKLRREGGDLEIDFNSRPSRNVNPHTNQPYTNYYFEGARPATQIEIPIADQPTGRKTDPNDAWRMCLNKGGELAVMTLEYMDRSERENFSFETQKQIAIGWAHFFMFTPFPTEFGNEPSGNGSGSQFQAPVGGPGAYQEPEFDDIPF